MWKPVSSPRIMQFVVVGIMFLGLLLGLRQGSVTAVEREVTSKPGGIPRLIEDTNGAVKISYNSATGVASFIRMPHGMSIPSSLSGMKSPTEQANFFFEQYGDAFGIRDPESELVLVQVNEKHLAEGNLTYQQVYKDIPVFAALIKARFNERNEITSVNGTFVPKISLKTIVPAYSAQDADRIALEAIARQRITTAFLPLADASGYLDATSRSSHDLSAKNNDLFIFRTGLAQGVPGRNYLVYEVEVTNATGSLREFVYVDAHRGDVVDQITGIYHALDRKVYEGTMASGAIWEDSAADPDPIPSGWEGGSAQQIIDWQDEIDGARETYNLFHSMAGWDSFDNAGAAMHTVNNDTGIACPGADWNGTSTSFCSGTTADDTVAHEWGHAYMDYTAGLVSQWQPGALNESYSAIWGEVVDLLNGRGSDTPGTLRTAGNCSTLGAGSPSVDNSYRWLSGEDDTALGAVRDMWNPVCYGHPGKVSDTEYWCQSTGSGGIHTNSGVPNHAFSLMVDGGVYNGQTINPIGLTKAAHIHWVAQSTILNPVSDFADHADALETACSGLIGVDLPALSTDVIDPGLSGEVITAADCQAVADAITAVELRTPPTQCGFVEILDPDAPALCEGLGTVQSISLQDWEGGTMPAGWTAGTHDVVDPATFDTPDWSVVDSLPEGANGTYAAFVPNIDGSDCETDDETGALYLDSPVITIPADVVPRLAFDHWVATEVDYDGGNVKISVNGGPWRLIPSDNYEFNAYNITLAVNNTNPLAAQPAFSGTNGGMVGGSWGQSQIDLFGLAVAGDSVQLRFDFGIDSCTGAVGWYVDDVNLYYCSGEAAPVCGDSILDRGETCDDGNSTAGDGCSSSCKVEAGWTCTEPGDPTPGSNVISDGSFEAGAYGGIWTEYSLNFGTPVCDSGCGTGTGTGPSDGDWWTWLGGITVYEEGSVSQVVTIPSTATDLTFDLEQSICNADPGDVDYMELTVDGNQEYFSDESSPICNSLGYTAQSVDLSSYADDAPHTITFHSETFGAGGETSFFLDNVFLSDNVPVAGGPSECSLINERLGCNLPAVTFDGGISSLFTVVNNSPGGIEWTTTADAACAFPNNTNGSGEAACADSDSASSPVTPYDTELVSNPFDLSYANTASLDFTVFYYDVEPGLNDRFEVDVWNGVSWINELSWDENHFAEDHTVDLLAYVGLPDVQVRFRYFGDGWDWYAQVDDVAISCDEAVQHTINNGWSLIGTNLITNPVTTAAMALQQVDDQGGDATEIDRWENGSWQGHPQGLPFNNFDLQLGRGYFIKATQNSIWERYGTQPAAPQTLSFTPGWNLIGFAKLPGPRTASQILADIAAQGGDCSEINRFYLGGWQGHVLGLPFNNFAISETEGYFVKCAAATDFTPTATPMSFADELLRTELKPQVPTADEGATISSVLVSNRRDVAVTITWETDRPSEGHVLFGPAGKARVHKAVDERGAGTVARQHQVTLSGLSPETTYEFEIRSGSSSFGPESVNTGPSRLPAPPFTAFGQVMEAGGNAATGALVMATLVDSQGVESESMSALVDGFGYWTLNLPPDSCSGYTLQLDVRGERGATAGLSLDACDVQPAPTISLEEQTEWRLYMPFVN